MSLPRSSGLRIILGIIATVAVVAFFRSGSSDAAALGTQKMASRGNSNPIAGLEVTIRQSSTSPPTIISTITNKNAYPVTVLQYGSPLDPLALRLGLFTITPEGASAPLELRTIQVRRMWPPKPDALINLEPGASEKAEIILDDERTVSVKDLGKKASIQLKGRWDNVWNKSKNSITAEDLENASISPQVFNGDYGTDRLDITVG